MKVVTNVSGLIVSGLTAVAYLQDLWARVVILETDAIIRPHYPKLI